MDTDLPRLLEQQCRLGVPKVNRNLQVAIMNAVVLDPSNGFNVDATLTTDDIQRLEELCVNRLMNECSPSLDTIKMQVYFEMKYPSREECLKDLQGALQARLSSVSRDICDSRVKSREEGRALYRRIVEYTIIHSGLGSTSDPHTRHEATVALESIYPVAGLGPFMVLFKKDKKEQLEENSMIVTGIRLFMKACKQEEEDLDIQQLMPGVLKDLLPVVGGKLDCALRATQTLVFKYTAVLERLSSPDAPSTQCDSALLRQALYNVRQHSHFLTLLQAEAHICLQHVNGLKNELSAQIRQLKQTVKPRTRIPAAVPFSLFKSLSKLWSGVLAEAELLNILNNIRLGLEPYLASQAHIFPEEHLNSLLEGSVMKTDEQRRSEAAGQRVDPSQWKTQEWFLPETTAHFSELPLQYGGVCGYTLVSQDGLLLPGIPSIGVLKHKEKLYAFNSKDSALKFAANPDHFIAAVEERVRCSPELVQLLRLQKQFPCASFCSEVQPEEVKKRPITKRDQGMQTELHPMESNIVPSYHWNEWQLRRNALKLIKPAHGTQTDQSHMRRENTTQTWLPKEAACQTKRDASSNTANPSTYLAGLTGRREAKVAVINLTLPVDMNISGVKKHLTK